MEKPVGKQTVNDIVMTSESLEGVEFSKPISDESQEKVDEYVHKPQPTININDSDVVFYNFKPEGKDCVQECAMLPLDFVDKIEPRLSKKDQEEKKRKDERRKIWKKDEYIYRVANALLYKRNHSRWEIIKLGFTLIKGAILWQKK
jgi:hypothetical protein